MTKARYTFAFDRLNERFDEIKVQLADITRHLRALRAQETRTMKNLDDVKQLVKDLDTETTALGQRVEKKQAEQSAAIQALKDQIAAGGVVTADDLDGLSLDLTSELGRLKAIGADPANPIPA